jgi:hypothetical protein
VSSSARQFAATAERARQAAMLTRIPVENAKNYVGVWTPQNAQNAINELDGRQSLLEGEKKNVGDAMNELNGQINTLKAKTNRSDAEELSLQGKKGQLQSFQMLNTALDGRIQQMKAAKGALKYDNFNNEVGKNQISPQEAQAIVTQGNIVDKETVAACAIGRQADNLAIRAEDLAKQSAAAKPSTPSAADATKPADTTKAAAATPADASKTAAANAKADATAAAQKPVVDVKAGQWLSRICANAKNADGSKVTLDQLRQQPENKPIFDRAQSGDVVNEGDKVTLPTGATCPWATTPSATAAASAAPAKAGPRKGLTKPDADAAKPTPATTVPAKAAPATPANAAAAPANAAAAPAKTAPADATTYAKLSDKQVNDVVNGVANAVGPKKGQIANSAGVLDACAGIAPNQLQQVKDAYNAKYGAQGWSFDKDVTGQMAPWNQRAMQALEKGDSKAFDAARTQGKQLDAQVRSDSDAIHKAIGTFWDDKNTIISTLKKNAGNPEMRDAIAKDYQAKHGESLQSRLDKEMASTGLSARNGADDVTRVNALLNGDTNTASAALLHSLLADGSQNPAMALQVMTKEIPADRRKAVADAFAKQYKGVTVEDMVTSMNTLGMSTDDKAQLLRAAKNLAQ